MSKETLFKHITYAAEWAIVDCSAQAMVHCSSRGPDFFNRRKDGSGYQFTARVESKSTEKYIGHINHLIGLIELLKDDEAFVKCFSSLESSTLDKPKSAAEARALIARVFETLDAEDSDTYSCLNTLKAEAESRYQNAKYLDIGTYAGGFILFATGLFAAMFAFTPLAALLGAVLVVTGFSLVLANLFFFSKGVNEKADAVHTISTGIQAIESFESDCVFQDSVSDEDASQHDSADSHTVVSAHG